MGSQMFTDKEIEKCIRSVEREHLCRCETCSQTSAVCPASASTLILEVAGRRLDVLQKQRRISALEAENERMRAELIQAHEVVQIRDAKIERLRGMLREVFPYLIEARNESADHGADEYALDISSALSRIDAAIASGDEGGE